MNRSPVGTTVDFQPWFYPEVVITAVENNLLNVFAYFLERELQTRSIEEVPVKVVSAIFNNPDLEYLNIYVCVIDSLPKKEGDEMKLDLLRKAIREKRYDKVYSLVQNGVYYTIDEINLATQRGNQSIVDLLERY